jgi:glycosyltransferase involved in cell wall biosynthesis
MSKVIIHLVRLYSPHIGGVETHVSALSKLAKEKGCDVLVITEQINVNHLLEETINGVKIVRIPTERLKSKINLWFWFFKNRFLFANSDIVQVHDVFWWIIPLLFMLKGKLFVTFHGWEGTYPIPFTNKIHRLIASLFAVKTMHVGEWIQKYYWDIPNEISYGGVGFKTKRISSVKNNSDHFVFIGRLDEDNDLPMYITFAKLLKSKFPNIKISWVGDGQYARDCSEIGTVTGFVDDTCSYLSDAGIVGASSYLSIWDSYAYGKAVCSFYSNKLKKAYLESFPEKSGLFISDNPKKMLAMYSKIRNLDKNHEKLQIELLEIAAKYNWKAVFVQYEKIWDS